MDTYLIGKCENCGQIKPLKNGICMVCSNNVPDILKQIFGDK